MLDLLPALRNLDDQELEIQCEVFDEFKQDDDDELALTLNEQVDVSNHREIFDVIFDKVWSWSNRGIAQTGPL